MNYQDVKNTYEPKVKAGYDAGCYVATFEGNNKLTDVLCDALDISARNSLAYFDGTEFGAFAAFADYLHSEFNVPAEDCEFMYMMALKMQFKHMSHGEDLTEVLNSVKKSSGLDLFDKPKEEWTVNQKTFVVKLKHDEYYKAVLREIGLETTPEEFWKAFARMFHNQYGDILAHYLHFYSTLPAMIPNMTTSEIPITENLSNLIATIHRTLVWLVKSGEMSLDPYVITDTTIRGMIARHPVIQVVINRATLLHSPKEFSYEDFKHIFRISEFAGAYLLDLTKMICKVLHNTSNTDLKLLVSVNGPKENADYILWPIYNTWLDMKAHGKVPTKPRSKLSESLVINQCRKDAVILTGFDFETV